MKVRIAVISDLHCTVNESSPKVSYLSAAKNRLPENQHPLQAALNLINREKLSVDMLLCPGDITDRYDPVGLNSGWSMLKEVSSELKAKVIIATPGNHDLDLKAKDSGVSEGMFQYLKGMAQNYPFENIEGNLEKFWTNGFSIHKFQNVLIFNLFSYGDTYIDGNTQSRKIQIREGQIELMRSALEKISVEEFPIRIALTHNHVHQFANLEAQYKDGDLLEGADILLKVLSEFGFALVIHGHKHIPRITVVNNLPIFCSGSFAGLANLDVNNIKNSFHILDINLNKELSTSPLGTIRTWEYSYTNGWHVNMDPKAMFPSTTGFGLVIQDIAALALRINNHMDDNDLPSILYTDLQAQFIELLYINLMDYNRLKSELNNLNLRVTFDEKDIHLTRLSR